MTTIAYSAKHRQIAGDRRITTKGGLIVGETTKVHKVGPLLVGFSGALALCDGWLDWFRTGMNGEMPPLVLGEGELRTHSYCCVYVDNMCVEFGPHGVSRSFAAFFAEGSGSELAMAILSQGGSPEEAVRVAGSLDTATGPKIDVISLDEATWLKGQKALGR